MNTSQYICVCEDLCVEVSHVALRNRARQACSEATGTDVVELPTEQHLFSSQDVSAQPILLLLECISCNNYYICISAADMAKRVQSRVELLKCSNRQSGRDWRCTCVLKEDVCRPSVVKLCVVKTWMPSDWWGRENRCAYVMLGCCETKEVTLRLRSFPRPFSLLSVSYFYCLVKLEEYRWCWRDNMAANIEMNSDTEVCACCFPFGWPLCILCAVISVCHTGASPFTWMHVTRPCAQLGFSASDDSFLQNNWHSLEYLSSTWLWNNLKCLSVSSVYLHC